MNSHPVYSGRLAIQQRVLPAYRVPFFDLLAQACEGGLSLFAGAPRPNEGITSGRLTIARQAAAQNLHLLGGGLYFCYQGGLMEWLTAWNPDTLIVEANARYLSTAAAARWMHRQGRRVIGWGLGAPPLAGPLAGFRRSRRLHFLSRFDALIAYSRRGADEYAMLGFPRQKIFVAPNAAAQRPQSRPPERAEPIAGRPGILFVGRLQARKRVDFLLRACADLVGMEPRLVIVGDGPERSHLEALARRIYPSAVFAGEQRGDDLKAYFEAADLFVLPGTGGLAVQEAMSHGLPVVVAKGDGTQDDLVREENGWQVPAEDYRALLEVLQAALSDVKRLRQMGKASYRIVSQEINLEKMVEVFVQVLNA